MAAEVQVIFNGMAEDNHNVPVIRFRDFTTGLKMPSFKLDVLGSRSFETWNIKMDNSFGTKNYWEQVEKIFTNILMARKYELVIKVPKDHDFVIDGTLLSKLIEHLKWVSTISCSKTGIFATTSNGESHFSAQRKVTVVFTRA